MAYNTLGSSSVLVGNYSTAGSVNISGNIFNQSRWNALEILSCWKPAAVVVLGCWLPSSSSSLDAFRFWWKRAVRKAVKAAFSRRC